MNKDTISFFALILMIVLLKIANVQPFATAHWLWVLSPLWLVLGLGMILLLFRKGIK